MLENTKTKSFGSSQVKHYFGKCQNKKDASF